MAKILTVDPALIRNGANKEAVRDQVELAVGRSGLTMDPGSKAKAVMFLSLTAVSHEGRGYSAYLGSISSHPPKSIVLCVYSNIRS